MLFIDKLLSFYRGIKSLAIDLRRRPEKLYAVCDYMDDITLNYNIDQMNKLPVGHSPYAYDVFGNMMAHTLLNRKQFDRLYAKPYKRLFEACEKYKKTFISYSEGCFERFGDFFNQYRKGTVALMVEQDDIFDFRKKYPHIALWGGIMVDTLGHGTVEENIDMTKKVIDEVGCDSGLVLQPNKMLTFEYDCIPENLIAISNFIMTYKV